MVFTTKHGGFHHISAIGKRKELDRGSPKSLKNIGKTLEFHHGLPKLASACGIHHIDLMNKNLHV
jgi:hypothetical protein